MSEEQRETHRSSGWKLQWTGRGSATSVYARDEPAYEIAMPVEPGADWIYFVHAPEVRRVKIGYTSDPISRLSQLRTGSPCELRLIKLIEGTRGDEAKLHYRFRNERLNGEWFDDSILDKIGEESK